MNWAHVHLIFNHVPVVGTAFCFLLLVVAMITGGSQLKKLSLVALALVAVFSIPVYLTGEPAEETVEHLAGVSEAMIEEHEEAAEIAFWGVEILGILCIAGVFFFRRRSSVPNWFLTIMMIGTVTIAGLMGWTANLGGRIMHPETRGNFEDEAELRLDEQNDIEEDMSDDDEEDHED